jgi:hypothetical protein
MMKHHSAIDSDPIFWDTFKAFHIPCGEHLRLGDGMGYIEFTK